MTSSDQPEENADTLAAAVAAAAAGGAGFVVTPEVCNCVSASRTHQTAVLRSEAEDAAHLALAAAAARHGLWVLAGSLALTGGRAGRFVNRSLLIGPDGETRARYDKIHMFDVTLSETEQYRESAGFAPGERAVTATVDGARVGLTVCYDLRFAYLFRMLAKAGAEVITVPSAFAVATGRAHWEVLLRARAIETGCFILAPAQTGTHKASRGPARQTWGHSLAVAPWGEVLLDAGTEPGVHFVDLDLSEVRAARAKIPSLSHDRAVSPP